MTATLDEPITTNSVGEPVFLWGPGYELTARQILDALGSYLATFGDNFGSTGVNPLDAIHAEVMFTGDYTHWHSRRSADDVAVIRARAETIAREFFHGHFPTVVW